MALSVTNSAFAGFRVIRRAPMTLVWWSLATIAFLVAFFALIGGTGFQMFGAMTALDGVDDPMVVFREVLPLYGLILAVGLPLGLIFGAVLNTASARAVIEPERKAWGYMRLGIDEFRVGLSTFLAGLITALACAPLLALAMWSMFQATAEGQPGLIGVFFLAGLANTVLLIWLLVKFSLTGPIAYAEKRVTVFGSWALTRGRFWPMFGMGCLLLVFMIGIGIVGSVISFPVSMMMGAANPYAMDPAASDSIAQMMTAMGPYLIVSTLINAVIQTIQTVVAYPPYADAYVGIVGRQDQVAETFA